MLLSARWRKIILRFSSPKFAKLNTSGKEIFKILIMMSSSQTPWEEPSRHPGDTGLWPTAGFEGRWNPFKIGTFWSKKGKTRKKCHLHTFYIRLLTCCGFSVSKHSQYWMKLFCVSKKKAAEKGESTFCGRLAPGHQEGKAVARSMSCSWHPLEVWIARKELHF